MLIIGKIPWLLKLNSSLDDVPLLLYCIDRLLISCCEQQNPGHFFPLFLHNDEQPLYYLTKEKQKNENEEIHS